MALTPTPEPTVTVTLPVTVAAAMWEVVLAAVIQGHPDSALLATGNDELEEALDAGGHIWDSTSFNSAVEG